ncbi:MAG: phage tail tape measure protein, partial [Actinomycetota bacterium]
MTAAFGRSGTAFTVTGFLIADVRQWDRGLDRAGRSLKEFNEQTAQAGLVLSAGLGAGLAASAAAAVRWESAFTGVRKTVDGTPAELRELEQSLLDLAQPLGLLPGQVAAIGETAGQLGIDTSGIDEFTEVIGQLTQTTVLQAEEAAFSLARFGEITQLTENEFDEFGSTLVALGNNFAATESEILELSTRLASYAEIAGFAEAETLGLATAAVAVGLPAEAAGTALGRVLNEMSAAVADGTDSLRTFADVAGLSVTEFSQLFETDAAAAFQAFVEGLATIEERGRSVTQVLDELGVGDARVVRTFQSLAGAGGLLGDALEVANTGWAENTALQEEFRQRAETAEFKLRQLQASLNELGIVLGEVILPIIGPMVVGLTEITQAIADLPEPVRAAIVVFTALGTAMIAVQSASTLLGARLAVLRGQLTAVGATGAAAKLSTLTGVMGRGGPLAVGIAVGITAIGAAAKLLEKDVESAAEAVERLLSADDQALRAEIEQALSTLDSLLARRRQNEDALRFDGATDEDFARFDAINRADVLANLGDQFQSFTTQGRDGLAVLLAMREELGLLQFEAIQSGGDIGFLRDAGDLLNASIEETIAAERERLEAMARSDARVEEAISTTRSLGEGTEEASRLISELATDLGISEEAAEDYVATQILLEDSTASAADELSRLRDELEGVIGSADEAAGINQDFERTLADLVEAADDAGTSLDSYTDAGQQNQDLLADAATGARDYADAILEQTGSVDLADAAFRGQIATLIEVAEQLGFTRGQVLDYLASLGLIPPSVVTEMLGDPSSALAAADAVASAIFGVPTGVNIAFGADLAGLQRALDVLDSVFRAFGSRAPTIEDFGQFLVNPSVRAGNIIGGTRSGGGGGGGGGGGADGPTELEIELERLAELYEFDRITRQ